MAGLGWKQWVTGDTVSAAAFQGYLQDCIISVMSSTSDRDTQISSPSEGMFSFTKDTDTLWYYDGAAWVATSLAADITAVLTAASSGLAGGGSSGSLSLSVDVNNVATATAVATDYVLIEDVTDNTTKKALISDITALAGDITEVSAGTALSGGGAGPGAVTLNVDVNAASVVTGTSADYILIEDVTDNTTKKCLASDIASDPIPLILALS